MAYNSEKLEAKLGTISETQESITSISQWIMFHKRHAAESAQTWSQFAISCPENLKLGLIYVANEVVQQSKIKQRDAFVDAFAQVLPGTLSEVYSQVPSQVQDRIFRVVKVWKERKVFSPQVLQDIDASIGATSSFMSQPKAAGNVPPDLQELVSVWPTTFAVPSADKLSAQISSTEKVSKILQNLSAKVSEYQTKLSQAVGQDEEDPSPAIEPDSDDEPQVYTAKVADEQREPKKQKVGLDPKVMSFLANMK